MSNHPRDTTPVQFEGFADGLTVCTMCGAVVPSSVRWQAKHRNKHEEHNNLHDALLAAAAHRRPDVERSGMQGWNDEGN